MSAWGQSWLAAWAASWGTITTALIDLLLGVVSIKESRHGSNLVQRIYVGGTRVL